MRPAKLIVLLAIIGLTLSGFGIHSSESVAEERVSLDYSSAYSVVVAPMTPVKVSWAKAYQDGDVFVVSGKVKRMHRVHLPGHLDLAIYASDGTLLAQESTHIQRLRSNRKGVLILPFSFRLAMIPPEGAKIRLQYHAPASGNVELSHSKS
ncbi:hypothetical protein A7E78_04350 [Syntrophotalea acetylenivorans]|uniref:Uncharacterized protein n=1 Tax=Syntrophotalea acetylenivorans TaxID=1842532 RepID=A0A1L3GMH6_9BACT|nr:hypothetical protein A7E78_04350 [Syntrophotalea acetylenivorans]